MPTLATSPDEDLVAIYVGPGTSWDSMLTLASSPDADLVAIYIGPGTSWDSHAHSTIASRCRSCRYLHRSGHILGSSCSLYSPLPMQILLLFA